MTKSTYYQLLLVEKIFGSKIITDDTRNNIREFFKKKNINIRYNNTAS